MKGLLKFVSIQLDNVSKSYLPGQTVTGNVIFDFPEEIDIQGFAIQFLGRSQVGWVQPPPIRGAKLSHYESTEEYFNHTEPLIENDGSTRIITPGRQSFGFSYNLPLSLPSTFQGTFGIVSFTVTAILETKKKKLKLSLPFNVNAIVDLNRIPDALNTISIVQSKHVTRKIFLDGGNVSFNFSLPKTGYVPGENIKIHAEIINKSQSTVYKTKLNLMQEIISTASHLWVSRAYFSTIPTTKTEVLEITTVSGPKVEKGETTFWTGDVMRIPAIPPTGLGNCTLIKANYYLQFILELPGARKTVKDHCEIIIGTIPLRSAFSELSGYGTGGLKNEFMDMNSNVGSSQLHAKAATSFGSYPDLPPPSYAEATQTENLYVPPRHIDDSGDEEFTQNFVPHYITYGTSNASH